MAISARPEHHFSSRSIAVFGGILTALIEASDSLKKPDFGIIFDLLKGDVQSAGIGQIGQGDKFEMYRN
ncbi:MAG: hypothetical protein K1X29_06170 [Bdellovibrionales bacterium]|nr:hypothetical protein [Bdellovibrionales bacterium]